MGGKAQKAFNFQDVLYLSLVALFASVKLGSALGTPVDPFSPAEGVAFAVLDAISSSEPEAKDKEKKN